MAKRLTRREFLKLGGRALVLGGVSCTISQLGNPRPAAAASNVELDGREIVARVGDTFSTIQVVPRYSKTAAPEAIVGKVQWGTDAALNTYTETGEFYADHYLWSEKGKHQGADGSSELVVSRKCRLKEWGIEPGDQLFNETDGSVMVVTRVVDNQTVAGTLSGGTNNCWNQGDRWRIDRTYYTLEVRLTGLQPSTKYYYRLLVRRAGEAWPSPRSIHSFRTRRASGEPFRFVIMADLHRGSNLWPEWDAAAGQIQAEQADLVIDMGDTWLVANGQGKPYSRYFPLRYAVLSKTRNGFSGYRGIADIGADCGYYLVRGNHEGISDYDQGKTRSLTRALMRTFVPNPNGYTYPQRGSTDSDYDQGYFAFEWGDALCIVMDCVKYKDIESVNHNPDRFHIGDKQLSWLRSSLEDSSHRWKFIFMHHLFGGGTWSKKSYGRGGAAFASLHEQANIQALAEQHGAHVFHAHDHLTAVEWANNVLYYCCGLTCGNRLKSYRFADTGYPNGYIAPYEYGYVVVDVSQAQVTIRYKDIRGNLIEETNLT